MKVPISYALHLPERADVDVPDPRPGRGRGARASSRPTRRPSPACAWRARPARWGGPRPACSTPPTRSPSRPSSTGSIPFTGIAEVIDRCLDEVPTGPAGHFEELFEIDAAAREHARGSDRGAGGREWPDELGPGLRRVLGADHPARVRALHRRQVDRDAGRALLPLLPAEALELQARRDRVRDRRDPARRLREDHRDEPGRARAAAAGATTAEHAERPAEQDRVGRPGRGPTTSLPGRAAEARAPRARLLQPAGLEADRRDRRRPGDEPPDRLRDPVRARVRRRGDHGHRRSRSAS